jgi:hypothetical protein
MDVDDIPAGVDFIEHLEMQLLCCDVFLTVIGRHWLDARDDAGHRRLENDDDYVVVEVAEALARNICVIPVVVDGAEMPRPHQLPDRLQPFAAARQLHCKILNSGGTPKC